MIPCLTSDASRLWWTLATLVLLAAPGHAGALRVKGGISGVTLDSDRGYCLSAISHKNHPLSSSGQFPVFSVIGRDGKQLALACTDPGWTVGTRVDGPNSVTVRYNRPEITLEVTYEATPERILITTEIIAETDLHLISVSDGGATIALPRSAVKTKAPCDLIAPAYQGQIIGFADPAAGKPAVWEHEPSGLSWACNFVGLVCDGLGFIFRPQHHSVRFTYGEAQVAGVSALVIGCTQFFRPTKTTDFALIPAAKRRALEITFAADADHNGQVDWTDIASAYRSRYLRPNSAVARDLYQGVVGRTAATDLASFKRVDFAPQTWWVSGGLSGEAGALAPLRAFMDLRRAGTKFGLQVGPQDDLEALPPDSTDTARLGPDGKPLLTAAGRAFRALAPEVASGRLYKLFDARLRAFDARRGDPWFFAGLTGELREDYRPQAPATLEEDFQARRAIAQYFQAKGLSVASDGLLEGLHETCDYSSATPYLNPRHWRDTPQVRCVPLLATIFQGDAIMGRVPGSERDDTDLDPGLALLYGLRLQSDAPELSLSDLTDTYFKQNLFWREFGGYRSGGDRPGSDFASVSQSRDIWTVTSNSGTVLTVDATTGDYRLQRGAAVCQAGISPPSPWGYVGLWNPDGTQENGRVTRKLYAPRFLGGDPDAVMALALDGSAQIAAAVTSSRVKVLRQLPLWAQILRPLTVRCAAVTAGRATLVLQSNTRQTVTVMCEKPTDWFNEAGQSLTPAPTDNVAIAVDGTATINVALPPTDAR